MLFRTLLLTVLAALLCLPVAPAGAEVSRKKAIWGPVQIDGVSQFPTYADLGVGIYQMSLNWDTVAPTRPADAADPADPAYRWTPDHDLAIAEAARYGMEVCLVVVGSPRWANGGRPWRFAPNRPDDYAQFVETAARRYPGVKLWMMWIEPSKAQNFQPLTADRGRRLRGKGLRGPRRYAQMVDRSYERLKRLDRRNRVIGGNTYTVGTVRPYRYIQALRLPSGKPPRMDMWGHNPFTLRRPTLSDPPLGDGYADFSDLDQLTGWLDRHQRPGGRRLPIFISEFSLPTDHPNHEFNFYVDRRTQASWITSALKITRGWRRIHTFGYLGLYDDPERENGDQVERGLLERDGTRKPAYEAFKRG